MQWKWMMTSTGKRFEAWFSVNTDSNVGLLITKLSRVSESLEYSVQAFWRSIATDPIHFHFMEKLNDLAKSAFLFKIAYVI